MMRSAAILFAIGLSLFECLPAIAGKIPCRTNKHIVAACFRVHGRLVFANGNPGVRIWRIGTARVLGVNNGNFDAEGDDVVPESALRILAPHGKSLNNAVYGDFLVCPLTRKRPGWMQIVCIEHVSHLISRP